MSVNVEVTKKDREGNPTIIKRFQRKTQESGVLMKVRKNRWLQRPLSPLVRRKQKLESIKRKDYVEKQIKLGKMAPRRTRRR